ncbi:MAG: hypothetical protein AAF483_21175 [Planctomycetota bacterium]
MGYLNCVDLFIGWWQAASVPDKLSLKAQEIPLDNPESNNRFQPSAEKPLVATPAAIEQFSRETILACLAAIHGKASEHQGLDDLQVFEDDEGNALWFMEDGDGRAITALLPEDY